MRSIFYFGAGGSFVGGILRYVLSTWIYKVQKSVVSIRHRRRELCGMSCSLVSFQDWQKVGRSLLQMISLYFCRRTGRIQPSRPWRRKHCGWQEAARAWPR